MLFRRGLSWNLKIILVSLKNVKKYNILEKEHIHSQPILYLTTTKISMSRTDLAKKSVQELKKQKTKRKMTNLGVLFYKLFTHCPCTDQSKEINFSSSAWMYKVNWGRSEKKFSAQSDGKAEKDQGLTPERSQCISSIQACTVVIMFICK